MNGHSFQLLFQGKVYVHQLSLTHSSSQQWLLQPALPC